MKLRIGLTLWIYVSSLFALAAAAGHLVLVLDLFSPLTATHLGPYAPMITQEVIRTAPRYPIYLAVTAAASLLATLYFWRSHRPTETKTYAVTLIAAVNFAVAAALPAMFYVAYFVAPKAANAA
jgi:hypothetical protein